MRTHKDGEVKEGREQAELALHHGMKSWSLVSLLETTELDVATLGCNVPLLGKIDSPSWWCLVSNGYMASLVLAFSA